ncbi:MAG: hypothetical protein GY952_21085 [Rhodobacteraceae bacterium]|nr:hypothetical protein [Paracoccaceae bacterium]
MGRFFWRGKVKSTSKILQSLVLIAVWGSEPATARTFSSPIDTSYLVLTFEIAGDEAANVFYAAKKVSGKVAVCGAYAMLTGNGTHATLMPKFLGKFLFEIGGVRVRRASGSHFKRIENVKNNYGQQMTCRVSKTKWRSEFDGVDMQIVNTRKSVSF